MSGVWEGREDERTRGRKKKSWMGGKPHAGEKHALQLLLQRLYVGKIFRRKKKTGHNSTRAKTDVGEYSRYVISKIRHTEHGPNYIAKEWLPQSRSR